MTTPTRVERLETAVYRIPTDSPEADGTFAWDATTMVVVRVHADGRRGIGYTYGPMACANVIDEVLRPCIVGSDPGSVAGTWLAMVRAVRNVGRPGVASMAISAVDTALWDLYARLRDEPLASIFGCVENSVAVYGSGGFTSYDDAHLRKQLSGWVHGEGIPRVKIKVGTDRGTQAARDVERVHAARDAIGPDAALYVDANGAFGRKQAVRWYRALAGCDVSWFEEPVSSDDLEGLHEIRGLIDADVAAGEYGYDLVYFERMLAAGAVDCVQADVTRCGGFTEWRRVAAVAAAHGLDISGHCAPALHLAVACAAPNARHLEWFHDHVRIERLLFDGVPSPEGGRVAVRLDRPGHGLELRRAAAAKYLVSDTRHHR